MTLKIGAHTVKVFYKESWPECDQDTLGQYFPERNELFIKKGLPPSQSFGVLVHEAIHFMNGTMNHEVVDGLAEQLTQFLWDNDLVDKERL